MNRMEHIKECCRSSASCIVCGGLGILLYALVCGNGDTDYIYGWYMWSAGSLLTSSQLIRYRKKEE